MVKITLGPAGTGKSFRLIQDYENCRDTKVVLAPTHSARMRLNIDGAMTLHAYFQINITTQIPVGPVKYAANIFIDEISMISQELYTRCIASYIATYKVEPNVYLYGDFAQLPPILNIDMIGIEKVSLLLQKAKTLDEAIHSFQLECIKERSIINSQYCTNREVTTLKHVYRVDNLDLLQEITDIRDGVLPEIRYVDIMEVRDGVLNGGVFIAGTYKILQRVHDLVDKNRAERTVILDVPGNLDHIHLYRGGRMLTTANSTEYYNGEEVIIESILSDAIITLDNRIIPFHHITPANVLTIHRAQGREFNVVYVGIDNMFEFGHFYTAVSRARQNFFIYSDTEDAIEKAMRTVIDYKVFK